MKKITLLLTLLISVFAIGQTPVLTMISDGDCSGGNPKVVEIYADGTVDFANYSLEIQTNANDTWGNTLNLTDLGVVTDDFVYIHKEDESFATEYPSATNVLSTNSSAVNFNGDDRVRIIEDATSTVVDQYGAEATDGTGEVWEYQDGYAKRNDGSGPDFGFFAGNWSYFNGALDGEGTCQGGATFESIIGTATYTPEGGSNDPAVFITSPANNAVLDPGTTSVDVAFSAQNEPAGAQFDITVNGSTTTGVTSPFNLTTQNGESYTVEVELLDGQSIAASASIDFSVADVTQVADIAALRADVDANGDGGFYEITGPVTFSHGDNFRNRKWFQNETGPGLMIFDFDGIIDNDVYAFGDQVTGLTGQSNFNNGVLQLLPTADNGVVTGNNEPSVQILSLSEFINNYESYESILVGFQNVSFPNADGTLTFENGQNYDLSDGTNTITSRTEFFNVDYIGTVIPQGELAGVVGVASEFNGDPQIFSRFSADIDVTLSIANFDKSEFAIFPNPASGKVNFKSPIGETFQVGIYNVLGRKLMDAEISGDTPLDISNLQSGIYMVQFGEGKGSFTKKLIVQ
ncbi:T9SS type A sorting domain-containing protein [Psychroflexus planctonicus]|uniref:Por secretion system C-terminal sorting domain-containing protein n=1 Tax=Psychroflexus planctonicus TaxID=1526575 RepID=A0ABQ1SFK2_9FLAO|nr:T9SS type A sorting domain-containing protein [Psychroflexus planctonicus]GGE36913.1 hypothetical protein GCM10010832_16370 [Psychroflexus planctonicus]